MNGVTIIETATLQQLIQSIDDLKLTVISKIKELDEAKKPYMTINELVEFTGLSRSAVNANRAVIGFTNSGNCIRFKRSDVIDFMERNYFKSKKKL